LEQQQFHDFKTKAIKHDVRCHICWQAVNAFKCKKLSKTKSAIT